MIAAADLRVGMEVTYVAYPNARREHGVVRGWNQEPNGDVKFVFVRYGDDLNAKATPIGNLVQS